MFFNIPQLNTCASPHLFISVGCVSNTALSNYYFWSSFLLEQSPDPNLKSSKPNVKI